MLKTLNTGDLTPKEEITARIDNLRRGMAEKGIELAIIIQNVDIFYFTGTLQRGMLAVSAERGPAFFVEKSIFRAQMETPLDVIPIKRDKEVKDILSEKKMLPAKCAMELDVVPVALCERWKSLLGQDAMGDLSQIIRDARLIKSEFEIEQIRRSGGIVERVLEKAKDVIREGVREIDIDAALLAEGRRWGHQGFLRMRGLNQEMMSVYVTHGYSTTITSGADVPISGIGVTHAIAQGASVNVVKRGIPIIVDYGGGYNGYITDETRAYSVGPLKELFHKPYEVARDIIHGTMDLAKEGTDATEVFAKALDRVKAAGLEDHFMGHGEGQVAFIGHGLGLEINELPVITPRHRMVLKEGMVFAFEPKFIFPGEGAIGIEVDFVVRKTGLERVTKTPLDVVYV
ncbi:MAG: Xaa-Pro peptidase family protein [Syntrophorhabdaceae bacterium]|nr:Xaa-Pro peptidase family protein [Syntrophorhabdaceae bacterium]